MLTEKAKEILKGVETKMGDTVSFLEEDLKTYRVGKANPCRFPRWLPSVFLMPGPLPSSLGKGV